MSSHTVHIIAYVEVSTYGVKGDLRRCFTPGYMQEGCAPQEYDVLLSQGTDGSLIFEPFGVGDEQTIAWFIFKPIEAGDTFIWVKDRLQDLPDTDGYTGVVPSSWYTDIERVY